jgi:ATP-binding cassette subfamily B protein
VFTAGATLTLGKGLQVLVDRGFGSGNPNALGEAVSLVLVITTAIAVGTFLRFYLVSWLGERVSADLRSAVFRNLVRLHPGFFEDNRSGEIMSRLTADTTVLQTIIGSSMSMALRSALTLTGALIMMLITSLKLTLIIVAVVPLALLPIMIFGRRVRALSTRSQDTVASVGSYAGEIIQNIRTVQGFNREPRRPRPSTRRWSAPSPWPARVSASEPCLSPVPSWCWSAASRDWSTAAAARSSAAA